MRETCARVLAAALMTGAIATAMGLPTIFESAGDLGRGLTAPPSWLERSVRAPSLRAPARAPLADRLAKALPVRPSVTGPADQPAPRQTTVRPRPRPRPATPAPAPAPTPKPRELTSTSQVPAEPAAPALPPPPAEPEGQGKNKKPKGGKAKGQDKKAVQAPAEQIVQPPLVEAAPVAPAPETEPDDSGSKDRGHGKGHDKEHKHKD